jgi:hypothetical protein
MATLPARSPGVSAAACALLVSIAFAAPAAAQDAAQGPAQSPAPSPTPNPHATFLVWSAGVIDVVDPSPRALLSLEWRYDAGRRTPSPWLAFETTEHDQFYAFGLNYDFRLGHGWVFTPSLGAAIYQEHEGLDLGYPLEFRSTAEVTYGRGRRRFGASFGHYSNFYLGERNRGTEILKVILVVPLSRTPASITR